MMFCSECGSQTIHTETCDICPCCGKNKCSCPECNPVFDVEDLVPDDPEWSDLESDYTMKINLIEMG